MKKIAKQTKRRATPSAAKKQTAAKTVASKSSELKFEPVTRPPIRLSPGEAKVFEGCDPDDLLRVGDALLGVRRDEYATATEVVVHGTGKTRTLELVSRDGFERLVASPSGKRFLIHTKKIGNAGGLGGARGHAIEVDLDDLATRVAITAIEHLESESTLWAADYVGDDDTLVASIGDGDANWLLLLERDPATELFGEIDNVAGQAQFLATSGTVIAADAVGRKNLALFGVVDRRLVGLGRIDNPCPHGHAYTYRTAERAEIHVVDSEETYRLVVHDKLVAKAPPRKPGTLLRRITREHPRHISDDEKEKLFQSCWKDARTYREVHVWIRSAGGYIAAAHWKQEKGEVFFVEPSGKLHREKPHLVYRNAHPTEDRAIATDGRPDKTGLFEVDLRSRKHVALTTDDVSEAWYVVADGRELLLVQHADGDPIHAYVREPMTAGLGELVGTFDPKAKAQASACGHGGFLLATPAKKELHEYRLVRVRSQGAAVTFAASEPIVLPGKRYADAFQLRAETIGGRGYVRAAVRDDHYFEVPADYGVPD
jgi:dipeptidyl aminopeptidase/acylaminoacyl peptidase